MARRLALVVTVALCALVLPAAKPPTVFTPGADGAGDPYFPLDGNGGYDVEHYDLDLTYDPDTDELSGTATIDVRATQNLSAFNLDFVGLTVDSIQVDGADAGWTRDEHELTITPDAGILDKASFRVAVTYHGVPELVDEFGGSGFIQTADGAVIMGEPHGAATWFPANDHPTDKASFTFHWTVPDGLQAVANGTLGSQTTQDGWTTWIWDAVDPMATYLATVSIGHLDITSYKAKGLPYWDAIDPILSVPPEPMLPTDGAVLLWSQRADDSYKRLTRVIEVPPGGASLSFDAFHDTEGGFDFLFVESRTAGGDDWTTLEEQHGHTSQDTGACPVSWHPFMDHYMTTVPDPGDPEDPDDDGFICEPGGTSGTWWAANGEGFVWEPWSFSLPNDTADPVDLEISITYASDGFVQSRGVGLDNLVVSSGDGSTSFEDDGDRLDGWEAAEPPDGSGPNENTWDVFPVIEVVFPPPLIQPTAGAQMLFSQVADEVATYKRLTRVLEIPSGGANLTFDTFHDTEEGWDHLFVEGRTPGGDDWTTLEEQNGFTSQDVGACPGAMLDHPFLGHYKTSTLVDPGDPNNPDDDEYSCDPAGTSGDWWAASGPHTEWETWQFALDNPGPDPIELEISITYESDLFVQRRGVTLDNLVVSAGAGSTSFEDDGDTLDGWVVADAPEGSAPNVNSWITATELQPPPPEPPQPRPGDVAKESLARQPEIIAFLVDTFGSYPFRSAGGIVDDVDLGFALETQTRPTYSPIFFSFGGPNFDVIVHELAHQWVGDSLAVERWQYTWLNEGFATYATWLWANHEGFITEQEIFDELYNDIFPEDSEFWELPIGDPGPEHLFDGQVYDRGAMTLHALRMEVGDRDFFRILKRWTRDQAGGNVSTDEFIALAEQVSHKQLDDLFDAWLFGTTRPELTSAAANAQRSAKGSGKSKEKLHAAVRTILEHGGRGRLLHDDFAVHGHKRLAR